MKRSKLAKKALNHPEYFTEGELAYFRMWLEKRKARKEKEKEEKTSLPPYLK